MQIDRSTIVFKILLIVLILKFMGGGGFTPGGSAPFPTDKLSVLIVESTEDRDELSRSQTAARDSVIWRAYVESVGGQWRVLDDQTDISKELEWVKSGMAVPRASMPWLVISTGKSGSSVPFPENLEALMLELKKFGGQSEVPVVSSSVDPESEFSITDSPYLPLLPFVLGS